MTEAQHDDRDIPPERGLLVVDMKDYSKIPESQMPAARAALDTMLEMSFAASGLADEWACAEYYKDTGDGVIFVIPPARMWRLVDPFIERLNAALEAHEQTRLVSAPAIRVRASVHVGPLSPGDERGDAINEACRLVSSTVAYSAIEVAVAHRAFVALVVSELAFRRTIGAKRSERLATTHFLAATAEVNGKPQFNEPVRVHIPGVSPEALAQEVSQSKAPGAATSDVPPSQHVYRGPSLNFHAPVETAIGKVKNLQLGN